MPKAGSIVLLLLVLLIFLFVAGVVSPIDLFDLVILQPTLNLLVLLSKYLFGNFGLAIVALTIIIRLVTLPLAMRQLHSSRAMQGIQPKMKELQKKYEKDKQQLGSEIAKLYKEQGVNPLGCALPMLIQMPIWIGLYQSVIQGLACSPENLLGLSKQLYSWSVIQEQVPLNSHFLWLDLGSGDVIMAILVAASMWMLQKMSVPLSGEPTQQSMQRMMVWLMPLMFGFISLSIPSGLPLFWVCNSLLGIVIQYRVTGWGTLKVPSLASLKAGLPQPVNTPANTAGASGNGESSGNIVAPQSEGAGADSAVAGRKKAVGGDVKSYRKKVRHGKHRDKRKVRRRSR